jgi:prepilin-type N-terminal cleavage/methylation domain-containing protein
MSQALSAKESFRPFTLVELLVVIAIIAILAAMLLPSLSRARERAKLTLELADRKQLGLVTTIYADDADGFLPSVFEHKLWNRIHVIRYGNTGTSIPEVLIKPYLGAGPEIHNQMMFCQSDLLDARYPGFVLSSSTLYGYEETAVHASNASTLQYYRQPWSNATADGGSAWRTDPFDISTIKADGALPMWSCMFFRKSGDEWFGHNGLADKLPGLPPAGGHVVNMDGSGRWVWAKDWVTLLSVPDYYYAPNDNGALTNATNRFPGP